MKRRRRRTRYARKSRLDRVALGALILSVGLLTASVLLNTGIYQNDPSEAKTRPAPARPADNAQTRESASARRGGDTRPNAASYRSDANGDSPATPAQFDDSRTPAPPPGVPANNEVRDREPISPSDDAVAADQPSAAAANPARADPRHGEPSAPDDGAPDGSPLALNEDRDTQDGDAYPSSSDMAKLETANEPSDAQFSSHVTRAQFSTDVVEREPVDRVTSVFPTHGEPFRTLYYFTEIENMSGETVIHRWEYNGSVISEISFDIGSDHWRTWSSKQLTPGLTGPWRVSIVDAEGHVLRSDSFVYGDL